MCVASPCISPGNRSVHPYNACAAVTSVSFFNAVRRPSKTVGSSVVQLELLSRAVKDAFSVRCHRSIIPFACGWYAVVRIFSIPILFMMFLNNSDSNCLPWSHVMRSGHPKRDIHPSYITFATVSAVMFSTGNASGQRVARSMMVTRYRFPSDVGRGPTISAFMCASLSAFGYSSRGDIVWRCTFVL